MALNTQKLEPLPYHLELRDYLKSQERDLWNWFASARAKADYTEHLRLELLKSTYRLDRVDHADLYRGVDECRASLGLEIPVTIYQAQQSLQLNASLFYMPGEGHIVMSGPVLTLLDPSELKSVIGHELAHFHLWQRDDGEFHITDRILDAIAADPRAASSHQQSARWYQLYTEIFADRGALQVSVSADPVVASLVKMETGMAQVSAASYLRQAAEIFDKSKVKTEGLSHPEAYIRARALQLWMEEQPDAEKQISAMIEGSAALDELDLVGQVRLSTTTRRLLEHFLRPKWIQTNAVLAHAQMFFPDFQPAVEKFPWPEELLDLSDAKLREYVCFTLLDFVTADPELDEMPLAAALEFAKELKLDTQFDKIATKELKLKVRELKKLKEQAADMLAKAEAPA
jgi:hypothetical protein